MKSDALRSPCSPSSRRRIVAWPDCARTGGQTVRSTWLTIPLTFTSRRNVSVPSLRITPGTVSHMRVAAGRTREDELRGTEATGATTVPLNVGSLPGRPLVPQSNGAAVGKLGASPPKAGKIVAKTRHVINVEITGK